MISYTIMQLPEELQEWVVFKGFLKKTGSFEKIVGFYKHKHSAIRKVKNLIQKEGGLQIFEVFPQNGRIRCYCNDENFNYLEFDYHALHNDGSDDEFFDVYEMYQEYSETHDLYITKSGEVYCVEKSESISSGIENPNEQSSLDEDDLTDFRVWADGTVQEVSEEPYSSKSDDYMIVKALDEEHAFVVWQQKEREAWGYEPETGAQSCHADLRNALCACAAAGQPKAPP